jgi:hypothetical protein
MARLVLLFTVLAEVVVVIGIIWTNNEEEENVWLLVVMEYTGMEPRRNSIRRVVVRILHIILMEYCMYIYIY